MEQSALDFKVRRHNCGQICSAAKRSLRYRAVWTGVVRQRLDSNPLPKSWVYPLCCLFSKKSCSDVFGYIRESFDVQTAGGNYINDIGSSRF